MRLEFARQANKTYKVDWAKMNIWGHEFMQNNPGSYFKLETDDKGRFKRSFTSIGALKDAAILTGKVHSIFENLK